MRDAAEFTEFVATRSSALLRTAYLLTGDRHLAEDLLQTALIKAYPQWGGLREPRAAESYVRTAMVRTLINWRKRRAWSRETLAATPPDLPTTAADDVETRSRLWPIVLTLPPRQRAVVVLRYYEDLTESQTAAILGCSTGTVKSHNSRALQTLRARLADAEDVRRLS
ncbi:MAG: SigE family RNA polymerase sigma factor [Nocardioidaceae bacterium]